MKTVKYGEYTISVDIEKTVEYYRNYTVSQTQAHRNFEKYCETLSKEEKDFFDSFGIDPICCEIEHIGVSKEGDFPCGGHFFVCGKYLAYPPENLITVEELAAKNFIDDCPDPRIHIGLFEFDFQCEDHEIKDIPEDIPEGFICIQFWCENMKWLLEEEPEERMYERPRFWEIRKIIKEKIRQSKMDKEYMEKEKQEFCSVFERMHIPYVVLNKQEAKIYRKKWVDFYTPPGADRRKVSKLCFDSHEYKSFLWHMFSYEFLPCEEDEAEKLFASVKKDRCVIVDNIYDLVYRVENADALTPELLKSFTDVTVTAEDFSWTYCKTHEEYCGPYFYTK